jgi:carbamoyl-phosphate synthase large subunit
MNKPKINVALSGLNATDNPGPGIPVARALKEASSFEASITGLAYEALEPGIYMDWIVEKAYSIPYPSAGKDALLKRLDYINQQKKIDVLIPNFDAELFSFIKLEKQLLDMGIHTFLPTLQQFEDRQKTNLEKFGEKNGIKVPKGKSLFSVSEIRSLGNEFEYPVVVKGKYYDAYIAYNQEQFQSYFNKISAQWGLPVIVQQFVYGTEFNVCALGDGKGNTIGAVPMRKQYITDKGKAWAGISIGDKKLLELTHQIIGNTQWRGGMELELMKDNKGDFYLLEINPRIPAWVYLTVGAGQNLPEALVNLALGNPVKPFTTYKTGKMFIRYSYDLIVDLKDFETISTLGEI